MRKVSIIGGALVLASLSMTSAEAQMTKANYCTSVPDCEVLNIQFMGNENGSSQGFQKSFGGVIEYCASGEYKTVPFAINASLIGNGGSSPPNDGSFKAQSGYGGYALWVPDMKSIADGTNTGTSQQVPLAVFGLGYKSIGGGNYSMMFKEISGSNLCAVLD